jgi:hypothetical protein
VATQSAETRAIDRREEFLLDLDGGLFGTIRAAIGFDHARQSRQAELFACGCIDISSRNGRCGQKGGRNGWHAQLGRVLVVEDEPLLRA